MVSRIGARLTNKLSGLTRSADAWAPSCCGERRRAREVSAPERIAGRPGGYEPRPGRATCRPRTSVERGRFGHKRACSLRSQNGRLRRVDWSGLSNARPGAFVWVLKWLLGVAPQQTAVSDASLSLGRMYSTVGTVADGD